MLNTIGGDNKRSNM